MRPSLIPDSLDAVLDDAWNRFSHAVGNRHSPLHTPVVASGDARQRVMVLRAADRVERQLRFHTDARSPKAVQDGAMSVLGYDPAARIQVTMAGTGRIARDGPEVDAIWDAATLSSRRCYLASPGPATPVDAPVSGIPDALLHRVPTHAESAVGRVNFAVLIIDVTRIDWLELTATGNRRAHFVLRDGAWSGQWLIP